ncbi:MAG: hypothetical protein R3E53_14540 [Myxococcota bacterium]
MARAEDRISTLRDRQAEIDQRMRGVDADVEAQQTQAAEAGREQNDARGGLRNLLSSRDRLQEQLREAMRAHEQARETQRTATQAAQQAAQIAQTTRARYDSLREVVEGRQDIGAGARHLLEAGDETAQRFGLKGLVRELIEADPEVERAVEAVLADRAEAIVIEDARGALSALEALRTDGAGRGVFVVQGALPEMPSGIVPLGDPLIKRVRPRAGSEGVARRLLGDVYLVDSLEQAFGHFGTGRLPATFVTPKGDLATPDGVVHGGGESSASGMLTRAREVRELEVEVARLDLAFDQARAAQTAAETAYARAGEELENLRNRHHTAALAVANHETDLERSTEKVKRIGEAQQSRAAERSDLLGEQEALGEELARLATQLEERRRERDASQRAVDALGLQISSAGRELGRRETRVAELRVAFRARDEQRLRLREGATRAEQSERETRTWIERRKAEIENARLRREALLQEIESAESALAVQLEAEETARIESDALREAFESTSAKVAEIEDSARELRSGLGAAREKTSQAELKLSEARMRLEHQANAVRERWNLEIADWKLPSLEELASGQADESDTPSADASEGGESEVGSAEGTSDELAGAGAAESSEDDDDQDTSPAAALRDARRNVELAMRPTAERQQEAEKVRKALASLGDVNLGAIEEHEELAERFRFLSEQKEDLEGTISNLREAIARINRTSRKRFRETFEAVSQHFSENFPRLFGGGKASLELTDAEDILEAGVDIMAMPPGKRLQNVNLLSGGEKTMTALALLVAVFQVRPSPFFLLDEVDAALDDANVGRFNQLITEMATQSQFLVITHNKRTIEVADVLYGVTMEQKGVSKLVSVVLSWAAGAPRRHRAADVARRTSRRRHHEVGSAGRVGKIRAAWSALLNRGLGACGAAALSRAGRAQARCCWELALARLLGVGSAAPSRGRPKSRPEPRGACCGGERGVLFDAGDPRRADRLRQPVEASPPIASRKRRSRRRRRSPSPKRRSSHCRRSRARSRPSRRLRSRDTKRRSAHPRCRSRRRTPVPEPPAPRADCETGCGGRARLVGCLGGVLGGRQVDEEALLEELEEVLFTADLGVATTAESLLDRVRRGGRGADGGVVRGLLKSAIAGARGGAAGGGRVRDRPHVVLVLGVNGAGKTTTIGKLAARHPGARSRVLLGAGDTFRAAAIEQLQTWGGRVGFAR